MDEVKTYYIRKINKLRRKTTSIMNKINNSEEIGKAMYAEFFYKFQQLDNTFDLLTNQIEDLNDIYTNIKNNTKENYDNLDIYKPLTKKEIDILFPLFYTYYNTIADENNENNENNYNIQNNGNDENIFFQNNLNINLNINQNLENYLEEVD